MASAAVAAGEGAFKTWMLRSVVSMRKSSPVSPCLLRSIALTPERPGRRSSIVREGTRCWSVFRNRRFENARRYSLMPKLTLLKNSFQVPEYPSASAVSRRLKSVLPYPSRLKVKTALGPHSISPFVMRVKWTPRKGKSGLGTG